MAKIFFNDKQSGDFLTAENVNDLKSGINDVHDDLIADISSLHNQDDLTASNINDLQSGINTMHDELIADISSLHTQDSAGGSSSTAEAISNGTVSGYYDNNNQFRYNHHIIPESNANFDLGSAEYKIRHLYLSSNSLWIGDENKIDAVDGKIQTKQRDKTKLPHYIKNVLGGTESGAIEYGSVSSLTELTLKGLEDYAKTLDQTVTLSKIFPPEDDPNYSKDDFKDIFQQRSKINEINPLATNELIALNSGTTIIDIKSNPINNTFFLDGNANSNGNGSTFNFINVPEVEGFQYQCELVFLHNLTGMEIMTVNVNGMNVDNLTPSMGIPEGNSWSYPSGIIGVRLYRRQNNWHAFLIKM